MFKKVLIISNVSGGIANFRKELLDELSSKYQVIVLAKENAGREIIEKTGCQFININFEEHGTNPIDELGLIKQYKKIIRNILPDIVLTFTIKPNIYAGMVCSKLNIPYIANVTGLGDSIENKGILSKITKKLYKVGLNKANMVFFQNEANCNFFLTQDLYGGQYDVIPGSGVNLKKHPYENYLEFDSTSPIVLSVVGRITKDKGIEEILEGARRLKGHNLIIQLIGDSEEGYRNKIHEAESQGCIHFLNRQENVHEWLKKSHAILHASYHEGMSNALLEAAACGRPIIATRIPGCLETFDDGISGIGFEPRNVDSLVNAVETFINLPYEEKKNMGIAGRKKIERLFDRRIVIDRYLEAIHTIEREKDSTVV